MICNPEGTLCVSSLGWVDGDALWRFDVSTATAHRVPLASGARYLSLHSNGSHTFAVSHHFDGARAEVTVHSLSDAAHILARAAVGDGNMALSSDASVWGSVPRLYLAYLGFDPWKDFVLLLISGATGQIEVQRLDWYDHTYDKMYQGVADVLEIPGERFALVSVQRSSRLILHDLATGRKQGTVELANRLGNPSLHWRAAAQEIWASDYDTIVVIDQKTLRPTRSARLQGAMGGTQQFIGEYAFSPDEDECVVARPFSGDVVGLDPSTLRVTRTAAVGRQPLEAVALPGGKSWRATGRPETCCVAS